MGIDSDFLLEEELVSEQLLSSITNAAALDTELHIGGAKTSYSAVLLSRIRKRTKKRIVCICSNYSQALALTDDLRAFAVDAMCLPWHQTRPYDALKPENASFSERIHALFSYAEDRALLCVPVQAALHVVPPLEELQKLVVRLHTGDKFSPTQLAEKLARWGYTRVPQIMFRGEFSLRGEVIDVFPPYRDRAIRLSFAFDNIEDIHNLDVETQLSTEAIASLLLTSSSEVLWSPQKLQLLHTHQYALEFDAQESHTGIRGTEYYSSLLYPNSRIDAYVQKEDLLVHIDPALIEQQAAKHRNDFQSAYFEAETKFPPAESLICSYAALKKPDITLHPTMYEGGINLSVQNTTRFSSNITLARKEIEELREKGYRVYILTHSITQQTRFEHLFPDVSVYNKTLHTGFLLEEKEIAVFTEEDILGVAIHTHRTTAARPIASFSDIQENSYVVHINHGIGMFRGIKRMQVGKIERDYLIIEYAQEDSIFVPIDRINLIQRYIGESNPKLDTIGGSSWKQKKKRIQKNLENIAERLIALYAERESVQGHAYSPDGEWQELFESTFPFDETPDQLQALQSIKEDMESKRPMDHLLCGDVGFGKTEVAMRAAFKAVMDAKQVALLAPTTILVEQHYETFQERMHNTPVRIAMLSRFVSAKDCKKILRDLEDGAIDIIIGTHKLLQSSIHFKDLGLIIIDEEQRFGVKHKEILKEWKKNTDCLMMSATPIPRTLHMSLLELRKMSLLRTPPKNRKPIKTVVAKFTPELVQSALRAELERKGQVFYLHNRIESLEQVRLLIQSIVPEASVVCVHGQMSPEELEKSMWEFVHERYNVMVSTTIIENGLDIPNVNTILIDRADMYGVAQLYQLRGRVGRSDRNAFAYLLYHEMHYLSDIALRRLEIIRDHSELGVGFQIAMHDMEMRGVGNLVGKEQSGNVHQLGLELYITMLNQAIQRRRENRGVQENQEVSIEIKHDAFIPSEYVEDVNQKIQLYQEIQSIQNLSELSASIARTKDRYGNLPNAIELLYSITKLRLYCRACGISEVKENRNFVTMRPLPKNNINMTVLLAKVANNRVSFQQDASFNVSLDAKDTHEKCLLLIAFLNSITIESTRIDTALSEYTKKDRVIAAQ